MHTIDLFSDNWKQAAAQESVDYQAVESTFMTQAYGFVANKAKGLFRDPFRLGFEIVHRNEKATKMVGIFAFRCNNSLLYAPVFFVNGEIKGADMLYRSEVKRFVPLSDEWCSFLVRGANEETGRPQKRNAYRQPDSQMHRLAYPQRTKYASDEEWAQEQELAKVAGDGSIFRELMQHCIDDTPVRSILPRALADGGPDALVKLASLIEGSDIAQRFVAENYSTADLTLDPDWCIKKAAADAPVADPLEPFRNSVVLVRALGFSKSASDRKEIAEKGYALEDYRELGAVNHVVTTIEDPSVQSLSAPGVASVLDVDGETFDALIAVRDEAWLSSFTRFSASDPDCRSLIRLGGKKGAEHKSFYNSRDLQVIGAYRDDMGCLESCCVKPNAGKQGKAYVLLHKASMTVSEPFVISGKKGKTSFTESLHGGKRADLIYVADAADSDPVRGFVNDDFALVEIKTESVDNDGDSYHKTVWETSTMAMAQLNSWLRTGGGVTHSKDITVTKEPSGLFTLSARGSDGFHKVARDLGRMDAHIKLAGDYEMRVSAAGEVLDFAEDKGVHRFRLFDTVKSAFMTRMNPEAAWTTGYDPVLNARVTAPQQQIVGTTTPERFHQDHRIGDRYMGEAPTAEYDPEEDGLPEDSLMAQSPEDLAGFAAKYDLPHIFDHQVIGSLAGNTYDTIDQVRRYIPDLETGVDRYARILFLLRYRPADFEEAYGKDELLEMEQELTSLFDMAGKTLLRTLKRFDTDKFSPQADS